ncbi:hypothetical protein [Mesobacillus zeae]|uniref:Uncharacterized protein n=1 Tax=Mesobacillus zeae TaxID=1917180 RepID=A0A398BCZ2_9BACI|nr:hypothetical protein [Mesobacillus zeae]RID87474.1 hypothetical protein D1970_04675 [Mesobacillus zeae]
MENLFLFSLTVGIVAAFGLVPIFGGNVRNIKSTKNTKAAKGNNAEKGGKSLQAGGLVAAAIILTLIILAVYYFTNLDRNLSSLWLPAILVTGAGTLFASGAERTVKFSLFSASLIIATYFLAAPLFNSTEKFESAKMAQKVEIKSFDEKETPASVPPQFARNKMKKAFGQVPNTSYYELGSLQIQKVKGDYVYVAPVEFSGFFKWMKGNETPGYFMLSATDSSANPKFSKTKMTYTPSSFFNKNIERHIRKNYPEAIFNGDTQLEIDEDGKPYYIRTYGEFISARNGFEAKGVVIVDAQSGKAKAYSLAEAPEFIDGAVSPETVSLQNSYFGNYVHGYWNSLFGKSDVKLPSDQGTEANVTPIFTPNGEMYYFTDFTSPKKGVDSMLGYSLTNARSGKATYYTGDPEEAYMDSQGALQIIEKKFIEKKWKGKMPVLYNFYGEASWLTPVLDSNGFLQNYFIVSAANQEISAYGNTPNEALRQYKTALQRGGGSVDGTSKADEKTTAGAVKRVYKEKTGDYTVVSFLLNNGQSYMISSEKEPMAIYLKEGDKVKIVYFETGEDFLPVKKLEIEGL